MSSFEELFMQNPTPALLGSHHAWWPKSQYIISDYRLEKDLKEMCACVLRNTFVQLNI